MPKKSTLSLTAERIREKAKPGITLWDSEVRGLGLRTSKGGTMSFVVKLRLSNGEQRKPTIGRFPVLTCPEARKKAMAVLAAANCGEDPSAKRKAERKPVTLGLLLDLYAGDYAKAKRLDAQTVKDAKAVVRIYMEPVWLRRSAASIDYAQMLRIVGEATETAKRREVARIRHARAQGKERKSPQVTGAAQVNRLIAVLSRLYNLGQTVEGGPTANPLRQISKTELDDRIRHFSPEEVGRLLAACDAYEARGPAFRDGAASAVKFLLFTGARLQEVLSAPWSQFDLRQALWVKPSSHTKQDKLHILGLGHDSPAMELLDQLHTRRGLSPFLFPAEPAEDADGTLVERPRADIKRAWAWLAKTAGLADSRPHDLRRTTASFMISDGTPLAVVGASLGHTQPKTTARYAKLHPEVQASALAASTRRMVRAA